MASLRNRYSKSLEGLNAIGFVSPAVDYATLFTTFAAFVAASGVAANQGAIGVFRPDLANTPIQTAALAAGNEFFIAQIVDNQIKKTPIMVFGKANDTKVRHTPYNAPVKQNITIGYNGATGGIGMTPPAVGETKTFVLSARDTSPSTQPFPVQEGRIVVKNPTATLLDMVFALVADFTGGLDYERNSDISFLRVNVISDAPGAAIAAVTATLNEGSATVVFSGAHTLAVGDVIEVLVNGFTYKVVSVPSTTVAVLDRPYSGPTLVTAAGGVNKMSGPAVAAGIILEAYVEDTTFVVTLGQDLQGALINNITPWKQGAGAPWQVAAMEDQTQVMDGYTTINAQWPDDYGKPTKFVNTAATYNQIYIQAYNKTASMGYPNEQTKSQSNVILASPVGGATPDTELITIFPVAV